MSLHDHSLDFWHSSLVSLVTGGTQNLECVCESLRFLNFRKIAIIASAKDDTESTAIVSRNTGNVAYMQQKLKFTGS